MLRSIDIIVNVAQFEYVESIVRSAVEDGKAMIETNWKNDIEGAYTLLVQNTMANRLHKLITGMDIQELYTARWMRNHPASVEERLKLAAVRGRKLELLRVRNEMRAKLARIAVELDQLPIGEYHRERGLSEVQRTVNNERITDIQVLLEEIRRSI